MNTIGHHTCSNKNGETYILKNAPFKSEFNKESGKIPFLGGGYYLWDTNLAAAHFWGKHHYKENYSIYECVLNIEDDKFLDLVGSRKDMIMLGELISRFESYFEDEDICLGEILEFLKKINILSPGIFDIDVVRAIDSSKGKKDTDILYFNRDKKHYIDLFPRLIICFYTKNPVFFRSPKIVFSTKE